MMILMLIYGDDEVMNGNDYDNEENGENTKEEQKNILAHDLKISYVCGRPCLRLSSLGNAQMDLINPRLKPDKPYSKPT